MSAEHRIRELVEEKIADREDLFIVSIDVINNKIVEILVDGDQGISIDDCVKISRHVGFHLEEEEVFDNAYRLEVSSPGVDKPLKLLRQFIKNIGRNVRVLLNDGKTMEGKLLDANEESIYIEYKKKEKGKKAEVLQETIPFSGIKETKVLISFK